MLTPGQRVCFVLLMSAGATALASRDTVMKVLAPNSAIGRSRRRAVAFQSDSLREITIATSEHSIEAQLGLPAGPSKALVLICHGIGERFYFWREVQHLLAKANIASLVFHYPGYGRTKGPFTLENVDASAHAAFEYLQGVAPGVPLFVFGTSLGTAVASHVVCTLNPRPTGLILAQGFTTLREAARAVLRVLRLPSILANLMPDVWRNTEALAAARCPVLIVHGAADELFPVAMAEELYRAAQRRLDCRQSLVTPAEYSHSDPMLGSMLAAYWQPILVFIEQLTNEKSRRRNEDACDT